MNTIYMIKYCLGGVRYYQNKKVFDREWKNKKLDYDKYMKKGGARPIEAWYASDNSPLTKIIQHP